MSCTLQRYKKQWDSPEWISKQYSSALFFTHMNPQDKHLLLHFIILQQSQSDKEQQLCLNQNYANQPLHRF